MPNFLRRLTAKQADPGLHQLAAHVRLVALNLAPLLDSLNQQYGIFILEDGGLLIEWSTSITITSIEVSVTGDIELFHLPANGLSREQATNQLPVIADFLRDCGLFPIGEVK